MKLIYCAVYNVSVDNPISLACVEDLSSFGWLQRGTIREHLLFATRLLAQKTDRGQRQTVDMDNIPFMVNVHVRTNGLAVTLVSDQEYPQRVAFGLINKTFEDFEKHTRGQWSQHRADIDLQVPSMAADLQKYQNPKEADKIMKIQNELDDIKEIMHQNIDKVLARGEPLEKLMDKSSDLSKRTRTVCHNFPRKRSNAAHRDSMILHLEYNFDSLIYFIFQYKLSEFRIKKK
eukprot:618977_1